MNIIIFSYRENWLDTCTRSCNCYEGSNDSSFEILGPFDGEEDAAEALAKRIDEDRHASYKNLVSLDGKNLKAFTQFYNMEGKLASSVHVPMEYVDDDGNDIDNTELIELQSTLRDLTGKHLDAFEAAKKKAEQEKKDKAAAIEAEAKKQKELKQLELLKAKYPETNEQEKNRTE